MPYQWSSDPQTYADASQASPAPAALQLSLWPHRSLPNRGFEMTIWLLFAGSLIPILSFMGSPAFWVLLGFALCTLAAVWIGLRSSDRDGLREEMEIRPDKVFLTHWPAKGAQKTWEANPYWITLIQRDNVNGIEKYLSLRGGLKAPEREVELGAFLSPQEREKLMEELGALFTRLKQAAP